MEAARLLGSARTAMVLTARGPEQQAQGVNNTLAYINLALALGEVGRPFSGFGTLTGQGNGQGGREHGQKADQLPGYRSHRRSGGAPAHRGHVWGVSGIRFPTAGKSAYELLDSSGEPDGIRALFVMGSNPVVSAPDARHVIDRLQAARLLVVCRFLSVRDRGARRRRAAVGAVGRGGRHDDEPRRARHSAASCHRSARRGADRHRDAVRARRRAGQARIVLLCGAHAMCSTSCAARPRGGPADYSGITYERIDAEDGVFWPCAAESSGHAAPVRRNLSDADRPRAISSRRASAARRRARRAVSAVPHDRARARALPVGDADAAHRRARRHGAGAARGDASAAGRRARHRRRRAGHARDPARIGHVSPRRITARHPRGHRLRAVSLGGRAVGQPPDQRRARSDEPDAGVQGVRRVESRSTDA